MYPLVFQLGPFALRSFAVMLALAVLAAGALAAAEFRRRGLDPALANDFLFPAVFLGLAGARLYYVLLFDPGWYLGHPGEVIAIWTGELAFHGALLAGLGTGLWFCWRRGIGFWRFADGVVPGLLVGQAIGAIGSFLHGSGYGTPTTLPWAVVFTDPNSQAPLGIPLHPTQLYAALGNLLLFAGLWALRGRLHRDGALFLLYLLGSSLLSALEFVRGDALWIADAVRAGPVVNLLALVAAAALWHRRGARRLVPVTPLEPPLPTHEEQAEEPAGDRRPPGVSR